MKDSYPAALAAVLTHEGGYVNHPRDPGGATNKGVTQKVYDAFRSRKGQAVRSVKAITDEEVQAIYRVQYWDAVRGDLLPAGIDYCVFDYGVNSGPRRAIKALQKALGVKADGLIGNVTLATAAKADAAKVIDGICDGRLAFLRGLETWSTFGRGWSRRVSGVRIGAKVRMKR